jgi:hypothetical protein
MPSLKEATTEGVARITAKHPTLGKTHLYCMQSPPPVGPTTDSEIGADVEGVEPQLLFTDNNTNFSRLYGGSNAMPFVKDAFHDHIISSHRPVSDDDETPDHLRSYFVTKIHPRSPSLASEHQPDEREAGPCTPFPPTPDYVNPEKKGTKSAAHYVFQDVPGGGGCAVVRMKLTPYGLSKDPSVLDEGLFDDMLEERREEADEFYNSLVFGPISDDLKQIMRQAFGGMLWTKQYYQFIQKDWINGDPAQPPPPPERKYVRNRVISSFALHDMLLIVAGRNGVTCILPISFPCRTSECLPISRKRRLRDRQTRWEYPFFAAWDTAFHCIPLAVVDPAFAKKQLDLLTREWYMKPDGQIPAYEWNFSDVNPPVHAWCASCWAFYEPLKTVSDYQGNLSGL